MSGHTADSASYNRRAKTKRRAMAGIKYFLLTVGGLIWMYPLVWMVSTSLKDNTELYKDKTSLWPSRFAFENYQRAWENANFSQYFLNTIIITAATCVIILFITITMGYALSRGKFRGRVLIMGVIAAASFIPMGFNMIPIFQLIRNLGLMNNLMGVILAESGTFNAVFILMFSSYFAQIPRELSEAATIDGCGYVRTFAQVMAPMARPLAGSVVIMTFVWTWSSFMMPLLLTLNNASLRTLAVGLYSLQGDIQTDWSAIAAGASIALIPVIIVFIFLQKYFVSGIAGAVKG